MLYQMGAGNDLDDLVQECWIKIWKGLAGFRGDSSVRTWIHRIATHAMYDFYRKKGVTPESEELDPRLQATDMQGAATVRTPEAFNTTDIIQDSLNSLSLEHRTALILNVMEEHTIEEIAKILDVAEGTIKSRLHHAKQKLKAALLKRGITHEFE